MPIRTTGRRRPRARAALVLALALAATLVPAVAHASETPGGTTQDTAVPVPVTSVDGTSFVASNAHVTSGGSGTQVYRDVTWYSLTPTEDVSFHVRASSSFDNTLEVWVDGALYRANDDSFGLDAGVLVDAEAGTTYVIGLGSYSSGSNGAATLHFTTRAPSAPTALTALGADGRATLTWSPPADDGGGLVGYEVECVLPSAPGTWCGGFSTGPDDTSVTVDWLENGQTYEFHVIAVNGFGASDPAGPASVVPRVVTATQLTVDPEAPVAGQPFDVQVEVTEERLVPEGWGDGLRAADDVPGDEQPVRHPAEGTVDVVVGGVPYRDVPLVDGAAVVEVPEAVAGPLTITATYAGSDTVAASEASLDLAVERLTDVVTLDVPTLQLGQQVRDVATSGRGLPVTLTATGACTAAGGVLTAVAAGDCVVTASTAGDRVTQPATATVTVGVTAPAPALAVRVDAVPGDRSAGVAVSVTGQGLLPGTEVAVVVHSTPRTLGTALVAADGSAAIATVLPADLEAGAHRIVVSAVAADRVSAFDHVLTPGVPDKGVVLTALSLWWFEQLTDLVPNHVVTTDVPDAVAGRAMVCRRLEMFPVECVARGYLTGSGLVEYRANGEVTGIALPPGLVDGSRLPEPVFTPATKAALGDHDENVRFSVVVDTVGPAVAERLRELTLAVYARAEAVARERGVILADTKLEFGTDPTTGDVTLGDEVLTPDSSRFWPADAWEPGRAQPSFDKQFVRDWLTSPASGWDRTSDAPPPALPADVVARTRQRYLDAYERLTGRTLDL